MLFVGNANQDLPPQFNINPEPFMPFHACNEIAEQGDPGLYGYQIL